VRPHYSTSATLFVVDASEPSGIINTTNSPKTSVVRDKRACLGLNNAAGGTLTLRNTATVGERLDLIQTGTGQWTIEVAAGGTLRSRGGANKTNGQWSACSARCVANAGGSAAEWLLTGDVTT
jgi:hypothetical protein